MVYQKQVKIASTKRKKQSSVPRNEIEKEVEHGRQERFLLSQRMDQLMQELQQIMHVDDCRLERLRKEVFKSDAERRQLKAALKLQTDRFEKHSKKLLDLEKRITMLGADKRMEALVIEKTIPSVHNPEDVPEKVADIGFLPIYD